MDSIEGAYIGSTARMGSSLVRGDPAAEQLSAPAAYACCGLCVDGAHFSRAHTSPSLCRSLLPWAGNCVLLAGRLARDWRLGLAAGITYSLLCPSTFVSRSVAHLLDRVGIRRAFFRWSNSELAGRFWSGDGGRKLRDGANRQPQPPKEISLIHSCHERFSLPCGGPLDSTFDHNRRNAQRSVCRRRYHMNWRQVAGATVLAPFLPLRVGSYVNLTSPY